MSADAKIQELGLKLPPAPAPMGVYKPIVITSNLAYLSGHGPVQLDGTLMTGRVGDDGTVTPLIVKEGDQIIFGKYSGTEIKVEGEERLILREDDILGVIES